MMMWEDRKTEIKKMCLGRQILEQWVNEPHFADTAVGAFVKISIGTKKNPGTAIKPESIYRLCEVVAVKDDPNMVAYKLLDGSYTRKKLTVAYGEAKRSWQITSVSNKEVADPEIEEWKARCELDNIDLPTDHQIERQLKKVEDAHNFIYTDEVINSIAAGGEAFKQGNTAIQRNRLQAFRAAAQDTEEYQKWTNELRKLEEEEERAKQKRAELENQGQGVSYINQRWNDRNYRIEKEVGRKNKQERVSMIEQNRDDPHLRRPTRNVCYFEMPNERKKKEEEKAGGEEVAPPPAALAVETTKKVEDNWPATPQGKVSLTKLTSQLQQTFNFDLNLDLSQLSAEASSLRFVCPKPLIVRPSQHMVEDSAALTLDQYRERISI